MKKKYFLKRSSIFLLALGLHGASNLIAYAQPNLSTKIKANISRGDTLAPANSKLLIKVLDDLETRYQVSFNYNSDQLDGKFVKNNLLKNNSNLEQTLMSVLTPLGLKFEKLQNNFYLIYTEKPSSQQVPNERTSLKFSKVAALDITGKIIYEAGKTLPGVSIIMKGTGTATDAAGNLALSVPFTELVPIFSFIGFSSKEMAVNKQTVLKITFLPDAKPPEEVVVVGYSLQKKSVVTGAFTSVKSTELENQQNGRLERSYVEEKSTKKGIIYMF